MGRKKLSPVYRIFITNGVAYGWNPYEIQRQMNSTLSQVCIQDAGQPIPTVKTIRKYAVGDADLFRGHYVRNSRLDIDNHWISSRKDPDDISSNVCDWIVNYILGDRLHSRLNNRMSYARGKDLSRAEDILTRRTAMWIATLFNRLKGTARNNNDEPQLIWSVARMYSEYERSCESSGSGFRSGEKFDPTAYDYYVSATPWLSPEHCKAYVHAYRTGRTVNLSEEFERYGTIQSTRAHYYIQHLLEIYGITNFTELPGGPTTFPGYSGLIQRLNITEREWLEQGKGR